ncbi:SNF1-interacting protein [Lobosporangium transversale]|uniref:Uncharacterized protein n=1 Tax=Lobosporangium transversale TaxID=64571 RepID=A0A1Y2GY50_9FUNG|nr:hypothetical protein BCR41DRAFT_384498 [Lobosporangium transversale]KAF9917453.1 SNF1-interacting protein [Lobosporangium transversale]ORZ26403.1 hypothetical protein BCR41DRAFT_384498 [Lobosporangium transversale]|eukprot:XP_021884168.1 hypothetical protein BCR41DRAFT_384498 [Lobosporangium transversale]
MPTDPPSVPAGPTAAEGVAAMIPVANITLEDALLDNPNFRANIKLFEGQVYFIESWLTAMQKTMAQFTEEWKRLNEVTSILNKRAEIPLLSQSMLSSQYTIPAMKLTGEAFRTTLALKHQYITEVNEKVLKPLDDFLKTDLKDFKDAKKVFDKTLEKYESSLAKYNGQSRQKEPSALREEAFQLYDTRKAYIQAAMACSMLCIKFQDSLDQLVLGVFLDLMATQHDYFSGNADHLGSMGLQVLQLKTYMKEHKEASKVMIQELEQTKERYTADAIEYWKPSRSLKCYSNNAPPPPQKLVSTIGHAALGPTFAAQMAGQVPFNALLPRPATISHPGTGNSRQPIPIQQFQSLSQSSPTLTGNHAASTENSTSTDTLAVNTNALTRSNNNINTSTLSLPTSSSNSSISTSNSITPYSATFNQSGVTLNEIIPTTKQGYLNIRIPQPKNRAPVWQRKYFFIQEGEFGFESVVSNPTVGSQVVQSERIQVLLCEVRYGSTSNSQVTLNGGGNPASGSQGLAMVQMERRFCFEVICATHSGYPSAARSYLLQAESEDDLMSWVNTFEAAKRDMLMQQSIPRSPEPDEPYSPMPDSGNPTFSFSADDLLEAHTRANNANNNTEEAEESKSTSLGPLGWAANVPGVSLLLSSVAGKLDSSSDSIDKPAGQMDPSSTEATQMKGAAGLPASDVSQAPTSVPPLSLQLSDRSPQDLDADASSAHERSRLIGDNSATSATTTTIIESQRSGHIHQQSEIEKLMTSSLHLIPKVVPPTASEIPHYPMELVVRNRELHMRFHGTKVHSKEYVLHSWTSGYRDNSRPDHPIMVYGRIFLTQSGMYFYARGLSVETKRMYRFSSIRGIECEQKDISTEWRIETMDGVQHIFQQFTLKDTEYQVLHLIWTNAHQGEKKGRLPVKELFRRIMSITNKPKGSAGSGSLAETESGHLASREGATHSPTSTASGDKPGEDNVAWKDEGEDLPTGFEVPSEPVSCNCPGHLEKNELDQTFDVSAKTMSQWLFGKDSPIWKEFHERRSNTVQSVEEWTTNGTAKSRVVKYLMVVNNPLVKLNQTDCVENQTCDVEDEYLRYSYVVKSNVLAMPYSDAFTPVLRYCITFVSKTSCKLTCSSGIEWHKNPMVKAMIKGAIIKGTAETVKDLVEIIQSHIRRCKAGLNNSGATTGSTGNSGEDASHQRSDSAANITISLHGPDDDAQSVILSPQDANGPSRKNLAVMRGSRDARGRRHTVSTDTSGPGAVTHLGPRVKGHWPTGSNPSFVPIGSKASRTRLLGKPSKSTLNDLYNENKTKTKAKDVDGTAMHRIMDWLKGLTNCKDEKQRRSFSTRLLYLVLLTSSLINIWAAYNSQRMLTSTWKLKQDEPLSTKGPTLLRGYQEPFYRIFSTGHGYTESEHAFKNVRVAARAVYLKDLEEQMQSGELEGFGDGRTINQKCFEIFLEVRDSFRPQLQQQRPREEPTSLAPPNPTAAATATSSGSPTSSNPFENYSKAIVPTPYPWLSLHHRQWATKLIYQRDRVGILRHDLLLTFDTLKQLERRLLETEYINWIMDERSRCRLWERRRRVSAQLTETDDKKKTVAKVMDKKSGEDSLPSDMGTEYLVDIEPHSGTQDEIQERIARSKLNHSNTPSSSRGHPPSSLNGAGDDNAAEHEAHDDFNDDIDDDSHTGETRQKRLRKMEIAQEFCKTLEHQIELLMLDK